MIGALRSDLSAAEQGAELARNPEIGERLIERSIEAVRDLCDFAERQKASQLVSIATAALRDADNGASVIKKLEKAIGGPIRVLSGEEEARIVYQAIRSRIALRDQTHLGVDLGGGSLELIVGRGEEIETAVSFRIVHHRQPGR